MSKNLCLDPGSQLLMKKPLLILMVNILKLHDIAERSNYKGNTRRRW